MSKWNSIECIVVLVISACFALGFAVFLCCATFASNRRRRTFMHRPASTLAEWCGGHYPHFSAIELQHVGFVANMFAQEIGVDVTQLDPKDKILEDYCLKGICSIFDCTWQAWTEKLAGYVKTVRGHDITPIEGHTSCNWKTLDDVIRGVVEMLQARGSGGGGGEFR